jgi:hypothetical protein
MSALMVDEQSRLQSREKNVQPPALRFFARVISWIFHPVFVPMMVIFFLVYVHPYLFAGFTPFLKFKVIMSAFLSFTFFPLVTVLLLKGLKFIDSIYLQTQKERIIPFVACMIWYFWISYVWLNFGKTKGGADIPNEAILFAAATFISTIIGLMVNIRMKVSLHAIAMGIVLSFFLLMALSQPLNFGRWLTVVFLVTGLVCTARLVVSDHTQAEVYGGLLTGAASILVARFFISWLG